MGLIENIQDERVRDLSLREAIKITADLPVSVAVERMRAKELGCAIVVDDQDRPLGVFTERSVIDLMLQPPVDWDSLPVGQHLEADWFCVSQDDPLSELVHAICERRARFFCVTDAAGHVVGLTGQKALSEYIAEHFPQLVMAQPVGSKPGTETREGA